MQGAEGENQAERKIRDEESINFRPSPNFKHMKKYLKSKFEEANQAMSNLSTSQETADSPEPEKGSNAAPAGQPPLPRNPPPPDTPPITNGKLSVNESASQEIACVSGHNKREKVKINSTTVVQPPLPPNPPPPDTSLIINLKKEIEDDEYQCSTTENTSDFTQNEELMTETTKTDQSESLIKPEVTMCRNFARGSCKKGASCIFAHKLILSQLPGVYTFCRNFQNSVCTLPKCKFVHSTVFEKEHFFRTGYLPPHALAHLKEGNVLQPPPPPPPEETPAEVPPVFCNAPPPPPPVVPCITPVAVMNCAAAPTLERTDPNIFRAVQSPTTTTSPKRERSDSDEFCSSPRDPDSSEPHAKKCKNCDSSEFREQFNKSKIENMLRDNERLETKINLLSNKNAKLSQVLGALLKKPISGASAINIGPDKENNIQTNNLRAFKALLAKTLLNNADIGPADAS